MVVEKKADEIENRVGPDLSLSAPQKPSQSDALRTRTRIVDAVIGWIDSERFRGRHRYRLLFTRGTLRSSPWLICQVE